MKQKEKETNNNLKDKPKLYIRHNYFDYKRQQLFPASYYIYHTVSFGLICERMINPVTYTGFCCCHFVTLELH